MCLFVFARFVFFFPGMEHRHTSSLSGQSSKADNGWNGSSRKYDVVALKAILYSNASVNEQIVMPLAEELQQVGALGTWEALATSLGFRKMQVDEIYKESSDNYGRAVAMLWQWTLQPDATVAQLAQALQDVRCSDVAVTVLSPLLKQGEKVLVIFFALKQG